MRRDEGRQAGLFPSVKPAFSRQIAADSNAVATLSADVEIPFLAPGVGRGTDSTTWPLATSRTAGSLRTFLGM